MGTSRISFAAAQKAELWERWKNGQGCGHLAGAGKEEQDRRSADRGTPWRDRAGAAPESLGTLRLEEREEISRGIAVGRSIRQIAQGLGRRHRQ